jgi:hypothetical protein
MQVGARRGICLALMLALGLAAFPLSAQAGDDDCEPERHSPAWWALRSNAPPGTRQKEKYGKVWPPYPRPTGPEQHWVHKYHHSHYWPYPYNCMDQSVVRDAIAAQAAQGWAEATTLHEYYFNPETQQLNEAGRLQLQWILTQVPPEFRTAFVASGFEPAVSQVRLASVQQVACALVGNDVPPILLRPDIATGRAAVEIDLIRRAQLRTMPRPYLLFEVGTGTMSTNNTGGAPTSGGTTGAPTGGQR